MSAYRNPELAELQLEKGIELPGCIGFTDNAYDRAAMDAVIPNGNLVTTASSGVPAYLSMLVDPTPIQVALAPTAGTQIVGSEEKRGNWTTFDLAFMLEEMTGYVSSYSDYARGGMSNGTISYVNRQSYHYQTNMKIGEREADLFGLTGQNLRALRMRSVMNTLNRAQNYTYIFGVQGLLNYGFTNDPRLPAAVTPITKAAGGTTWAVATPNEVLADFQKLFNQLVVQTQGLINLNSTTSMTLALPPGNNVSITLTNSFGKTLRGMINEVFPGVRFVTVPEFATQSGNLVQLWVNDINGQRVGFTAFTEKMRAHQMVPDQSGTAWNQKFSQGTFGAIIEQPLGVAQMLGT